MSIGRVALSLLVLAGCGGAGASPPATAPPPPPRSAGVSAPKLADVRVALRAKAKVGAEGDRVTRPFSSDATWLVDASPRALGVSADDAWKAALENVRRALPDDPFTLTNNVFIVFQHDDAPAALLFPELLVAAAQKHLPTHEGHLVAVAPEENVLLYVVGGPGEVALLRAAAKEGKTSAHPLSGVVMEWDGQAWREAK